MVTCPVVLVAHTRLCPTVWGCRLGQLGQGSLSHLGMMHQAGEDLIRSDAIKTFFCSGIMKKHVEFSALLSVRRWER